MGKKKGMSYSKNSFARMWQMSFMKDMPSPPSVTTSEYPDTLAAVDKQISADVNGVKSQASKRRF